MTRTRRTSTVAIGIALASMLPASLMAQNASIAVSATVRTRPLTLLHAALTTVPGELLVRFDGCGSGAIAVDAQNPTTTRRTSRVVIDATSNCTPRTVALHLASGAEGTVAWVVTLEQTDTLLSPAFAQFVVPAAVAGTRPSIAY